MREPDTKKCKLRSSEQRLTFSRIAVSTVGDIMMTQVTVTSMKKRAYMKRVEVDCLILGQQPQHREQAADPQQQASCRKTSDE